jgi:hypothetical protein
MTSGRPLMGLRASHGVIGSRAPGWNDTRSDVRGNEALNRITDVRDGGAQRVAQRDVDHSNRNRDGDSRYGHVLGGGLAALAVRHAFEPRIDGVPEP